MKIARIICCELDSTLRPTIKRGFDIIPVSAGIDTRRASAVGATFFVKRIARAEQSQKRRYGVILCPVN